MASPSTETRTVSAGLTAVVAALPEEIAPLRRRLRGTRRVPGVALDVVVGQLGAAPVAVAVTGDGEHNALDGLNALVGRLPVQRLLVIGVSGALSPHLGLGALVVAGRVMRETGHVLEADGVLAAAAAESALALLGTCVSALQIADTPAEKLRLLRLTNTSLGAAAVDLESAAYASVAIRARIPWLCLRSISDTADEALPGLLNACRDERGGVRRNAVVWRLLSDPRPLPALLALRQRVRHSAEALARGAEAVLAGLPLPSSATVGS